LRSTLSFPIFSSTLVSEELIEKICSRPPAPSHSNLRAGKLAPASERRGKQDARPIFRIEISRYCVFSMLHCRKNDFMKNRIDTESNISSDALRARRAIGAMFFSFFGGAWMAYWAYQSFSNKLVSEAIIFAATLALAASAYRRYRLLRAALAAEIPSPAQQKAGRIFNIVNVTQWIVILVVGNVLANIGLSRWVIPVAIFIIGMHFLPLAYVFANRYHFITGSGLIVLSIAYPFLAPGGASDPVGCLGAGIILWISALWAIMVDPAAESKESEGAAVSR
jgi:hypothetical protein